MDPADRFNGRAVDYDLYRPRYPAAVASAILDGLVDPVVADVGAGTGIGSEALRDAGARVIAIEPNAAMRDVLARKHGIEVREGRGEATGLPDGAVDVVALFQAFHWCDGPSALLEFARILRRPGRLAIVGQDFDRDDLVSREYVDVERHHGGAAMIASFSERAGTPAMLAQSPLFEIVETLELPMEQRLDREGLRGRIRSLSHVPLEGPERSAALGDADELFSRHARGGFIMLHGRATVTIARRTGAPQ